MLSVLKALLGFVLTVHAHPSYATRAVGGPYNGSLKDGFSASDFLIKDARVILIAPREQQFSTRELAKAVQDIGRWAQKNANQPILLGAMSLEPGGQLGQHFLHRNGLDADVAYLSKTFNRLPKYERIPRHRFPEAFVKDYKVQPNFDVEKNFRLLSYLTKTYSVETILVACAVKEAFMQQPPQDISQKDQLLLFKKLAARGGHNDHFHLRLKCPKGHTQCKNEPRLAKDSPYCDLRKYCPKDVPDCVEMMNDQDIRELEKAGKR